MTIHTTGQGARHRARTQSCAVEGCTAPQDADHDALHSTSNTALLMAFAASTHRLDSLTVRGGEAEQDLRAVRDLIRNEVLRRMGGAR